MTVFGQHRCAYCCIVAQVLLLVGGDGTTWYVEPPTALLACVTEDQAQGLRQPWRSLQNALLMHDDIITGMIQARHDGRRHECAGTFDSRNLVLRKEKGFYLRNNASRRVSSWDHQASQGAGVIQCGRDFLHALRRVVIDSKTFYDIGGPDNARGLLGVAQQGSPFFTQGGMWNKKVTSILVEKGWAASPGGGATSGVMFTVNALRFRTPRMSLPRCSHGTLRWSLRSLSLSALSQSNESV